MIGVEVRNTQIEQFEPPVEKGDIFRREYLESVRFPVVK
jgi:hypothetical protein